MAIEFYKDVDLGDFLTVATWDYQDNPFAEADDPGNTTSWGLNDNLRSMADALCDLDDRVTLLDPEDMTDRIEALETDVGTIEGDIIAIQGDVSDLQDAVSDIEDILPTLGGGGISVTLEGTCYVKSGGTPAGIIKWFRLANAITLSKVKIAVREAPTGASLQVDVLYSASSYAGMTSIFSSLPTIADGAYSDGTGTVPTTTALAEGGWVGIKISQVGSTLPGTDLAVTLIK
jgi:hypothetical protein